MGGGVWEMRGEERQERRGMGEEGCGVWGKERYEEEGCEGRGVGRRGVEEERCTLKRTKASVKGHGLEVTNAHICSHQGYLLGNMSFTNSSITHPHPVISLSVGFGFQSSSLPRLHHNLRSLQKKRRTLSTDLLTLVC